MGDVDRRPLQEQKARLIERRQNYAPERKFKEFTYDAQGRITDIRVYLDSAKLVIINHITFLYNPDGSLAQRVSVRNNGQSKLTRNFTYDVNGNIVSTETV